jgi:hypothetical protein
MALFKKALIAQVLDKSKTQTRRIHKYKWKIGNTYKIKNNYHCKGLGSIKITRAFKQRLGDISDQDIKKEGFENRTDFINAWNALNGSWNPDIIVIVYEFNLIEKST